MADAKFGRLSFVEIGATDPKVVGEFLSSLFDWKFTSMGDSGGWLDTPTMKIGVHPEPAASEVGVYCTYFNVPDLSLAIARVKALGGHAEKPKDEGPEFGRFCECRTPDGLRFGLHQT